MSDYKFIVQRVALLLADLDRLQARRRLHQRLSLERQAVLRQVVSQRRVELRLGKQRSKRIQAEQKQLTAVIASLKCQAQQYQTARLEQYKEPEVLQGCSKEEEHQLQATKLQVQSLQERLLHLQQQASRKNSALQAIRALQTNQNNEQNKESQQLQTRYQKLVLTLDSVLVDIAQVQQENNKLKTEIKQLQLQVLSQADKRAEASRAIERVKQQKRRVAAEAESAERVLQATGAKNESLLRSAVRKGQQLLEASRTAVDLEARRDELISLKLHFESTHKQALSLLGLI